MPAEIREGDVDSLRLPKNWHSLVRSAVLNVIGIVRIAMLAGREALIKNGDSKDARIHQLESEVAMLREELRINYARMRRVPPHRRPQYTGMERMAILQLRAMRGWNKSKTSRHFLVSDDTIRDWLRRADDDSLVQTQTPVNRFPDFVRYAVQQIKLFCPTLGKVKIADKLARAGIHIGKTTVERILKERPAEPPSPTDDDAGKQCRIVSKYPGHTWNADLTAVPISGGFWTHWIPNSVWQRWPVCWWVLNVIDHFSRRSVGYAVFKCRPTSEEVTAALDRVMSAEQVRPKHLIVDHGSEFKCTHFENDWCTARNIRPRFGAVGKHGSIAVVERFHRTLKEIRRRITIPEDQADFEREVGLIVDWYNEHRPHATLGGKTPNEVHFSRPAANEQPRSEPRKRWPRGSPCAKPQVAVDGNPGDAMVIELDCLENRRHLPVIRVRRVA
jgi:putative transposase